MAVMTVTVVPALKRELSDPRRCTLEVMQSDICKMTRIRLMKFVVGPIPKVRVKISDVIAD